MLQGSLGHQFLLQTVANQELAGNVFNGGGGHVVVLVFSGRLEREEIFLTQDNPVGHSPAGSIE